MRPRLARCCLPLVSAPSYRASVPVPPGVSGPGCGVCRFPGGEDVLPEARRKAKEGGKPGRAAPLEEQRRGDPLGAAASSTQLPSIAKNKEVPPRNSIVQYRMARRRLPQAVPSGRTSMNRAESTDVLAGLL